MNFDRPSSFGYFRSAIVAILLLLAIFALYLDFAYLPPQWIIADDAIGRFLAFLMINLGPEAAVAGIGLTLIEYFLTREPG